MSYKLRTRDEHFHNDGAPKRTLALDGGGLRRLADRPLFSYLRYDLELSPGPVRALDATLDDDQIDDLSAMDAPENMEALYGLGTKDALRSVNANDLPAGFDLR